MEPENKNESYQGLLGLDTSPEENKTFHMVLCFVIATLVAIQNYFHTARTIADTPLHWIAWISPTCIAVAWLRLAGVKWRYALLLFIFVPVATFAIIATLFRLAMFFLGD